jgi:hypothetical protein
MSVNLSPVAGAAAQFLDNSGNVLTGGKLYTYLAGTTTPAATYTSSTGLTFHSNPIILDAAGRISNGGEIWLTALQSYKFVIKTSTDVLLGTYDNIFPIIDETLFYLLINDFLDTLNVDNFVGTGSQVNFVLTKAPTNQKVTNIYINGVYQQKNTYSVAGATVTFSAAPPVTSAIEVNYV